MAETRRHHQDAGPEEGKKDSVGQNTGSGMGIMTGTTKGMLELMSDAAPMVRRVVIHRCVCKDAICSNYFVPRTVTCLRGRDLAWLEEMALVTTPVCCS